MYSGSPICLGGSYKVNFSSLKNSGEGFDKGKIYVFGFNARPSQENDRLYCLEFLLNRLLEQARQSNPKGCSPAEP